MLSGVDSEDRGSRLQVHSPHQGGPVVVPVDRHCQRVAGHKRHRGLHGSVDGNDPCPEGVQSAFL